MAKSNNTLCLDKFYPEKDLICLLYTSDAADEL